MIRGAGEKQAGFGVEEGGWADGPSRAGPAPHCFTPCPRVQKCADLNQMTTKNLSLLFAPSLFQTDGKGEHEVKVMEDLIDNYVSIFNVSALQVPPPCWPCPCPRVSSHDGPCPSACITHPGPVAPAHSTLTPCVPSLSSSFLPLAD